MATHATFIAWRIPWTEVSGRLQSMGSQRVGQNWATKHTHTLQTGCFVVTGYWPLYKVLITTQCSQLLFLVTLEMTKQELGNTAYNFLWTFSHICVCVYECVYAGGTRITWNTSGQKFSKLPNLQVGESFYTLP